MSPAAVTAWVWHPSPLFKDIYLNWLVATVGVGILSTLVNLLRLRKCNTSEVLFDVSPMWRLTTGLGGSLLILMGFYWIALAILGATEFAGSEPLASRILLLVLGLLEGGVVLALGGLIAWGISRLQVRFDLEGRIYAFRRGTRWQQRSMDGLQSIRVDAGQSIGAGSSVKFIWSQAPGGPRVILWFWNRRKARAFAQRLADVMKIPITECQKRTS